MPATSASLREQMLRRRPVVGAAVAAAVDGGLKRSIGTFQLTMFGVGSTIGTGIFFVLSEAVPQAGPGVIVSFVIAGVAAGLAAICYAELASAVPVSGWLQVVDLPASCLHSPSMALVSVSKAG